MFQAALVKEVVSAVLQHPNAKLEHRRSVHHFGAPHGKVLKPLVLPAARTTSHQAA